MGGMPTGDWLKNNPHLNPNPKLPVPSKEELEDLYHNQKMSTRAIATHYKVGQRKVREWMIDLLIPRRTYKDNMMPTPKGSHLSIVHRIAISEVTLGREGKKGEEHHNWKGGVSHPLCKVCKKPISYTGGQKNGMCLKCLNKTPARRKQLGDPHRGKPPWNKGQSNWWAKGELNNKWKGGVTPTNEKIRRLPEYVAWRIAVFKRDDYTCVNCGSKKSSTFEADHKKPFSQIIDKNSIRTIEAALQCKDLWDIDNGRTLCHDCHLKIGWNHFRNADSRKKLAPIA